MKKLALSVAVFMMALGGVMNLSAQEPTSSEPTKEEKKDSVPSQEPKKDTPVSFALMDEPASSEPKEEKTDTVPPTQKSDKAVSEYGMA